MCIRDSLGTGRKHVRKIIHRVGVNLFPYLLDVMEADISAQSDFMRLKKLTALKETREAYREIPVSYTHLDVYKRQS